MDDSLHVWVLPILAGITLSAATGLRAFLPLAVVAWAAHFDKIPVSDTFAWIGSIPSLVVFTTAVVVEGIGDKVPAVDHVLDALGFIVKPLAAALIVAVSLSQIDPLYAVVIGLIAGASVATGVHMAKAKGRVLSSAFTLGLANPILSLIEEVFTILLIIAALFLPFLGLAAVVLLIAWILRRKSKMPASA